MLVVQGPERIAREEIVKKSIGNLAQDPIGQKTMLRLEPMSVVSMDLDKRKGIVYDFEKKDRDSKQAPKEKEEQKVLDSTIRSGRAMTRETFNGDTQSEQFASVS